MPQLTNSRQHDSLSLKPFHAILKRRCSQSGKSEGLVTVQRMAYVDALVFG